MKAWARDLRSFTNERCLEAATGERRVLGPHRSWLWAAVLPLAAGLGCEPPSSSPATSASTPAASTPAASAPATSAPAETAPAEKEASANEGFDARLEKALQAFDRGELEDAWGQVQRLAILRPQSPELLFLTSRILAARGDLAGALQMLERIPASSPQADAAAGQAAEWLVQRGDLEPAEKKLVGVLQKFPSAVPALRLLARIYNAQGRRWEAHRPLERLVRMGDFTSDELLATVDYRDFFPDLPAFQAFQGAHPNHPFARFAAIRSELLRNGFAKHVDELTQLATQNPDQLEPWIWTATCLLELERETELAAWLQTPRAGADKHPEYWYVLGRQLLRGSQPDSAARAFAECIGIDRRHVPAYQGLADALLELGRVDDGQRVRDQANALVRINDLAQQLMYQYGSPELYGEIASLYRSLDDDVAGFGWEATGAALGAIPMSDALQNQRQSIRKNPPRPPRVLQDLPVSDWPLPNRPAAPLESPALSPSVDVLDTTIRMEDVAEVLGIREQYDNGAPADRGWLIHEGLGGGVAVLDFDRDGWVDLWFSQAGSSPSEPEVNCLPKMLYRSRNGKTFERVAEPARCADRGYGQGVGVADVDQDGFPDLLAANIGSARWYRNNGDGTFDLQSLPETPESSPWNSSIHAADFNGDHLPDLLIGNYVSGTEALSRRCEVPNTQRIACHPKIFPPGKNRILFNRGDGTWDATSEDWLPDIQQGYTLGTLVSNIDGRFGNDVFFANDVSPNALLLSQRDSASGTLGLVERAAACGVAIDGIGKAQACMGIAFGDQNRDGLLDLIVTNFYNEFSTLYLQTAPGVFVDGSRRSQLGIATVDQLSFGCQLIDLDNDGWLDFVAVNGHIDDLRAEGVPWHMPTQILKNNAGKFQWLQTPSPGPYFDGRWIGRGLSLLDFDRNGLPDLVATHIDRPAALLRNTSRSSHRFLQLELVGTASERDATGALVRVESGKEFWVAAVNDGEGYYGSNERLVCIGLGNAATVDRVEVRWPSGRVESWPNLDPNRRYRLVEGIGVSEIDLEGR